MLKLVILKTSRDFDRFRKSRAYFNPLMRLRIVPSNQNMPRFGFIIPKKTVPKVTDRNKIKRRLKEILKANLNHIHAKDVLIFPNKEALYQQFRSLNEQLIKLFKQAGLWKS